MTIVRISTCLLMLLIAVGQSLYAQEQLTWDDCLREAAAFQPDLIIAKEDIVQSNESRNIVLSSTFPQVSASAGGSSNRNESGHQNTFDYGVSGTQLIFDGLKTVNNVRAASENTKAAAANYQFTSAQVRFRLRSAFINLLRAQESVELTSEIYKIRKEDLDLITLRYESGTEHRGALLTAQANMAEAAFESNQAQRDLELAQHELVKEIGWEKFKPVKAQGDLAVSIDTSKTPDLDAMIVNNPSLLRANALENAARYELNGARGNFLPEVSLVGDIGKSGGSWPPSDQSSGAGVRVSLPIFQGGRNAAELNQAKSSYRQSQQNTRSTKNTVKLSLYQEWNSLKDALESLSVSKQFLEAAIERSKIAEQQYSVGSITYDNWTIIEDGLVNSKKAFLSAQANALLAEANWILAKGETLEYEK